MAEPLENIEKVTAYSHTREAAQAREADRLLMCGKQPHHGEAGLSNLLLNDLAMCGAYAGALQAAGMIELPTGHNLMGENPQGARQVFRAACAHLKAS